MQDDILRLRTAVNPAQAHLWCTALEEEGIRCQVVGDYLEAGLGDLPGARPELWVHRQDVERATSILDAHPESTPEEEES
jgi:hypothetical protein